MSGLTHICSKNGQWFKRREIIQNYITVSKIVRGNINIVENGVLYNWYAATYNTGGASIAPIGWHLPSESEFSTLVANTGNVTTGDNLREQGTDHWIVENGATNIYGFNAFGAGVRDNISGLFSLIKLVTKYWTSNTNYVRSLDYQVDWFGYSTKYYNEGISIRCIKDNSTDTGTVTDYDGNIYPTVKIGDQVWMAANLMTTHYNDGTLIPNVTDNSAWTALTTGAMCYYNNNIDNAYTVGDVPIVNDETEFEIIITGLNTGYNDTKLISLNNPIVFEDIPSDTYIIEESFNLGYKLKSIVPSEVTVNINSNIAETIITNEVVLPFVSVWKTDNTSGAFTNNKRIKLPLIASGEYDFIVDWGDSTTSHITTWNQAETIHTYTNIGVYTVSILGILRGWRFNGAGEIFSPTQDCPKFMEILQTGCLQIGNLGLSFSGCGNLTSSVMHTLNLEGITNLANTFSYCTTLEMDLSAWDVSNVTNMEFMFSQAILFNSDLSNWDVSNVTNTLQLFNNCALFNSDLSNWNVSKITNMASMFAGCTLFNSDLNLWDVSNVTEMYYMFASTDLFNSDLSSWNVENVVSMYGMFLRAISFNQNLGNWNPISLIASSGYGYGLSVMLIYSAMDTINYSNTLIGWAEKIPPLPFNITLNGMDNGGYANLKYNSSAVAARAYLTTDRGWDILDGGLE